MNLSCQSIFHIGGTIGAFVAAVLFAAPVSAETLLEINSESGHWIGQGVQQTFLESDGTFAVSANYRNDPITGIRIRFDENDTGRHYSLSFDARGGSSTSGELLQTGEYLNATRFPFNSNNPGLSISTNGRSCNQVHGEFEVLDVAYNTDGSFQSFAAEFTHYCETPSSPALRGRIYYNYDVNACDATDLDGDGVINAADTCDGTTSGRDVDMHGCSQQQFCREIKNLYGCYFADWKNDVHHPQYYAQDCIWDWNNNICNSRVVTFQNVGESIQ